MSNPTATTSDKRNARVFRGNRQAVRNLLQANLRALFRQRRVLAKPLDQKSFLLVHQRVVHRRTAQVHSGHYLHVCSPRSPDLPTRQLSRIPTQACPQARRPLLPASELEGAHPSRPLRGVGSYHRTPQLLFSWVSPCCCGGRLPRRAGLDSAVSNLVSVRSICHASPVLLALSALSVALCASVVSLFLLFVFSVPISLLLYFLQASPPVSNIFRTLFQFLPVHCVFNTRSIAAHFIFGRAIPFGK